MDKKKQAQIIYDHEVNGLSYRSLGRKYGMAHAGIFAMIKSTQKKRSKAKELQLEASLPDDVKTLKEELRKAKLKIELLDTVIDLASKELGVDIRKKPGTRQL